MKSRATREESLRAVEKALQIGRMRSLSISVKTRITKKVKVMSKSPRISICHFKLIEGELEVWLSLLQR